MHETEYDVYTKCFRQLIETEERNPSRAGGEDVQILRLDDETRREETYHRQGESEVLTFEEGTQPAHVIAADVHNKFVL